MPTPTNPSANPSNLDSSSPNASGLTSLETASSGSHDPVAAASAGQDVTRVQDLTTLQWRSGIAAWLGWLFDGLDTSLYILVALPFVASLVQSTTANPIVSRYAAYIQAAFLVGCLASRCARSESKMFPGVVAFIYSITPVGSTSSRCRQF